MAFKAPFLNYDHLRKKAEAFLGQYYPDRNIPVPIEMIVERDFKIDIVPVPGLQEAFDVVAFITKDLSEIRIDDYVFRSRYNRYRFSLAHELGHRVLHPEIFTELDFADIAGWKEVVAAISPEQYSFLEFHANAFAGLILMPTAELRPIFFEVVSKVEKAIAGVDFSDLDTGVREIVEQQVANPFHVSQQVAERRIEKDKLWEEVG